MNYTSRVTISISNNPEIRLITDRIRKFDEGTFEDGMDLDNLDNQEWMTEYLGSWRNPDGLGKYAERDDLESDEYIKLFVQIRDQFDYVHGGVLVRLGTNAHEKGYFDPKDPDDYLPTEMEISSHQRSLYLGIPKSDQLGFAFPGEVLEELYMGLVVNPIELEILKNRYLMVTDNQDSDTVTASSKELFVYSDSGGYWPADNGTDIVTLFKEIVLSILKSDQLTDRQKKVLAASGTDE